MPTAAESVQAIQRALEPYVRPREEAEHIRRILALQLRSCYENGPQSSPLALADSDCTIKSTSEVRGLQREYLKALHTNIKAQREYEAASQRARTDRPAGTSSLSDAGRLEEHVANIKLKKKQERLQTLEKYLELLSQKPAASPEFLQPEEIFEDVKRLPEVPKTVVSSFTVDNSSTKNDLRALVDRLEKAVLRSKLLLRREEQLFEEVKSRSTATPGKIADGAKLAALNTTRNELIIWMETELGNASTAEESYPREGYSGNGRESKADKQYMDDQLVMIKEKYTQYVAARKTLVQIVSQNPVAATKHLGTTTTVAELPKALSRPHNHLITPYIENLLAVSKDQKASITQKSHLGSILAKQREDAGRALDRLAEESQLLPDHHSRPSRRGETGKAAQEITKRVQPWVSAADAAKLATLEMVAEKIEDGQVALEKSTKYLAEIDQLLGRKQRDEIAEDDSTVDDIWLAETQTPRKGTKSHIRTKSDAIKEPKDIWSTLDGNLGVINTEDSPRKQLGP